MFEINGIDWEIEWCSPTDDSLRRSDGSLTVGMTDNRTKTIYLSDRLSGDFLRKVTAHELVHCFCFSYGVLMDIKQEEFMADWVSRYGEELIYLLDDIMRSFVKSVKNFRVNDFEPPYPYITYPSPRKNILRIF